MDKPVFKNPTSDHSPVVRRLGATLLLNPDEVDYLENIQSNRMVVDSGADLIRDGDDFTFCYALTRGWALSWRMTNSGRRQIINVYLPGDLIGIQVNFSRRAAFTISAQTDIEVALIEPLRVLDIYRNHPVIAAGLDWSTVRNFNIVSEHNVSMGARAAPNRILHLFLELWCRLLLTGDSDETGFRLHLNQQQIAEACGLSLVHTNKSIAKLKRRKLIEIERNYVSFPKLKTAMDECDFDGHFLDQFRVRDRQVERLEQAMKKD